MYTRDITQCEFKNGLLVERDVKLSQEARVLILERTPAVVLFLVLNVANDGVQLRMSVRECSIALLPTELSLNPFIPVNEIRRVSLYVLNQIGQR